MYSRAPAPVSSGSARPRIGQRASGHGTSGTIAAVPEAQPLARDGIWRVTLAGETFGRLVHPDVGARDGRWRLLRVDDVTDEQFDLYEAAMSAASQTAGAGPGM